jgi:methionyl aminopeptidase
MKPIVVVGATTAEIDAWITQQLKDSDMISQSQGYMGYKHVSCISVNDVIVHGIPSHDIVIKDGDIVGVDVCASLNGYCADMARCFVMGSIPEETQRLLDCTQEALDKGIKAAVVGKRLFDISHTIQRTIEACGYGIVREFAGHGIGRKMHENPDLPNYGEAGTGMRLKAGMTFAIEPMVTAGSEKMRMDNDGWTARTKDGSLAAHIEDTVLITEDGPEILTRPFEKVILK